MAKFDTVLVHPTEQELAQTLTGAAKAVTLWDLSTGERVPCSAGSNWASNYVTFSPAGGLLAVAVSPQRVILIDASSSQVRRTWEGPGETRITRLAFSPDGCYLIAAGHDGARMWEIATGRLWSVPLEHEEVAFSPDSCTLAAPGRREGVDFWDVRHKDDKPTRLSPSPYRGVVSIAFSPDGHWLAAGQPRGVKLWPWRALLEAAKRNT
jgi:WD40 repeat protein